MWTDLNEIWGTPSILSGARPDTFWLRSCRSKSGRASGNFVFFWSGKERTTLPTSGQPNFTKFAHKTWSMSPWILLENIFENLPVRVFFPKSQVLLEHRQRLPTSGHDFSEMNTNREKWWQIGTPTECWLSICTTGINSKLFPWPVECAQEVYFRMRHLAWFTYFKKFNSRTVQNWLRLHVGNPTRNK